MVGSFEFEHGPIARLVRELHRDRIARVSMEQALDGP